MATPKGTLGMASAHDTNTPTAGLTCYPRNRDNATESVGEKKKKSLAAHAAARTLVSSPVHFASCPLLSVSVNSVKKDLAIFSTLRRPRHKSKPASAGTVKR